jgi:hypothetical protein
MSNEKKKEKAKRKKNDGRVLRQYKKNEKF